jgi:hypothetical protein
MDVSLGYQGRDQSSQRHLTTRWSGPGQLGDFG